MSIILPTAPIKHPLTSTFFGRLKDALRGRRVADDELKHSVLVDLRLFSKEFYATGIQRLTQRWKKCVDMKETVWKNNLNFVNDVPMI